jgi:two-component system response regulator HydG
MAMAENPGRRILVVDDESFVCDSIKSILASDGHQVVMAFSAEEAMKAFRAGEFDIVITDYEMPVMKGDKLAAAMKALRPGQPIILITAYAESLRHKGNFPLGVDLVMPKPFALQEMREAVQRLAPSS